METHLTYDTTGKQLGVLVKQRLTTSDNLQVKVVGVLNTVSGHFEYCAKVRKYLCHPKANLRAAAAPPKAYLLPSGRKAQVGLGLTYLSHTDDILAGLMARKQLFVGPATNPITVKVKAQADFNTHTAQVDGVCRIQLSKTVYNFTHMQDIQGMVGYKAHCNQRGKVVLMPYAQIRDNNWTLFFDCKGYIGARYDLSKINVREVTYPKQPTKFAENDQSGVRKSPRENTHARALGLLNQQWGPYLLSI